MRPPRRRRSRSTPIFATTNPPFAPMNPPVLELDRPVRNADCPGRTGDVHCRVQCVGRRTTATGTDELLTRDRASRTPHSRAPRAKGTMPSFSCSHRCSPSRRSRPLLTECVTAARGTMTRPTQAGDSPSRTVDVTVCTAESHGRDTQLPDRARRRSTCTAHPSRAGATIFLARNVHSHRRARDGPAGVPDCHTRPCDCHIGIGNFPLRTI